MARSVEAIVREAIGGFVLIQAQLQAQCDGKDETIAEQAETIEKLTNEVALLTAQTHARPD